MRELLVLISREYTEKIRNKTFIVSTVMGLLVIIGLSFAPAIKDLIRSGDHMDIVVLEESGEITPFLQEELSDTLPNGEREFEFTALKASASDWEVKRKELIDKLLKGDYSGVLEISPPDSPQKVIWHTKQIDMGGISNKIKGTLQQLTTQERIAQSGLTPAQVNTIFAPIEFDVQTEGLRAATKEQQTQNMLLVYFLLFILYFSLINYGMMVAQGVIEEKSSRIMETMISTVRPTTLMTAKILGIGAVGLTQYIVMVGGGIALFLFKSQGISFGGINLQLSIIDPMYLVYFFVFFLLGFLLYATLYAGMGAMISRVEDTNQAVTPLTFLIVIGFIIAMAALYNPDNPWIIGLSYFPFFTPMILFARIVLTQISTLSILIGIVELLLTTVLLIWLAGRMYRIGVLLYGKVSLKDIFRFVLKKA